MTLKVRCAALRNVTERKVRQLSWLTGVGVGALGTGVGRCGRRRQRGDGGVGAAACDGGRDTGRCGRRRRKKRGRRPRTRDGCVWTRAHTRSKRSMHGRCTRLRTRKQRSNKEAGHESSRSVEDAHPERGGRCRHRRSPGGRLPWPARPASPWARTCRQCL